MNAVFLGMKQDDAASAAGVIREMIVLPKYGWSVQSEIGVRLGNYFKADLTSGHNATSSLLGRLSAACFTNAVRQLKFFEVPAAEPVR
jgi:hypothetical protein